MKYVHKKELLLSLRAMEYVDNIVSVVEEESNHILGDIILNPLMVMSIRVSHGLICQGVTNFYEVLIGINKGLNHNGKCQRFGLVFYYHHPKSM